jgi:hypothetical protein
VISDADKGKSRFARTNLPSGKQGFIYLLRRDFFYLLVYGFDFKKNQVGRLLHIDFAGFNFAQPKCDIFPAVLYFAHHGTVEN